MPEPDASPQAFGVPVRMRRRLHEPVVASLVLAAVACGDAPSRTLVVMTPLPVGEVERLEGLFEEAHPDVDVRMARLPVGGASALERASGQVDVLWGVSVEVLAEAAAEERLLPGAPSWAGDAPISDRQGRWHALPGPMPFVLAFDAREVSRAQAPRDWRDLLHARWAGELVLLDPARDERARTLMASLILQELRRTGAEYAGFDLLRALDHATAVYAPDVRDVLRRLEIGEGSLTILPVDEVEAARAAGNDWLEHRFMESGVPAVVRGVAVLAGAQDPEAAAAFVDLVGARPVAAAGDSIPAAFWPPSPDTLAERTGAWMARWADEVRDRSPAVPR